MGFGQQHKQISSYASCYWIFACAVSHLTCHLGKHE